MRTLDPDHQSPAPRRRRIALIGTTAVVACSGLATAPALASSSPSGSITLVAYSTPAPAYTQLIPAFEKTSAGRNVQINPSYGASGTQSRSVAAGLPADIVNFSLLTDMERVVPKFVSPSWNSNTTTQG